MAQTLDVPVVRKGKYLTFSVCSHRDGLRDQHPTRSQQQQRHAGSPRLRLRHHPVRKNRSQTGTEPAVKWDKYVYFHVVLKRKPIPFVQGLVNVALDILSRIHTIPTVPIVDCFQKIRQQVKCYLQLAGVMGKNECMQVSSSAQLERGIDVWTASEVPVDSD